MPLPGSGRLCVSRVTEHYGVGRCMSNLYGIDGNVASGRFCLSYFYGKGDITLRYGNEVYADGHIGGVTTESEFHTINAVANAPHNAVIGITVDVDGGSSVYTGRANEPYILVYKETGPANDPTYAAAIESPRGIKEVRLRRSVSGSTHTVIDAEVAWRRTSFVWEAKAHSQNSGGGQEQFNGTVYIDIKDNDNYVKTVQVSISGSAWNVNSNPIDNIGPIE